MKTPVNYVISLQRHELTPEMIGALKTILVRLEQLIG